MSDPLDLHPAPFCATRRGGTRRAAISALLAVAAAAFMPLQAMAAPDDQQQRILVFGDSQAQGLAGGVQRLYRGDRDHRVLDRSRISTGLNPRSSTDWPAQARTFAATERADIAIALFGANDRPPVRIGGRIDIDLWQRYADAYGTRVAEIARCFRGAGVPLVWVGHPIVRDPAYAEDMALLNDVFATRAAADGATFLPTWDVFKGADGAFATYGRGADGQTIRLRADDGVHLTPAGYDLITAMLLPYFDRYRRQPAIAGRPPSQG